MSRSSRMQLLHVEAPRERVGQDDAPLIALVPADRCNVIAVDVPEMSASRLARALRWAAEDALATDAENQHVVPIRRRADGRLDCLVASTADMQAWLERCPRRPSRMLPDAACVPWQPGELVALPVSGAVLVRWGELEFDRVDLDLLDVLLPELIESADRPRLIWLGDAVPESLAGLDFEARPVETHELALLAGPTAASPANLMFGDYPAAGQRDRPRWRPVAVLAGLAVVLLFSGAATEHWMLERQSERLDREIRTSFSRLFPDITSPQRPRVQAERALAELGGGGHDRFVAMMRTVSPLFSGLDAVEVESLRFAGQRLELALRAPGLDDIEALQKQLEGRGLATSIDGVNVDGNTTSGRLQIAPGPGTVGS